MNDTNLRDDNGRVKQFIVLVNEGFTDWPAYHAALGGHRHDPFHCPSHVWGCSCPTYSGFLCNPYEVPGYCPDDLALTPDELREGGGRVVQPTDVETWRRRGIEVSS